TVTTGARSGASELLGSSLAFAALPALSEVAPPALGAWASAVAVLAGAVAVAVAARWLEPLALGAAGAVSAPSGARSAFACAPGAASAIRFLTVSAVSASRVLDTDL